MVKNYIRTALLYATIMCGGALLAVSCGSKEDVKPGNGQEEPEQKPEQEPEPEPEPEVGVFASYAESNFSGNGKFTLILSTAKTSDDCKTFTSAGTYYEIDLFAEKAPDARNTGPADGVYTFDKSSSKKAGTLGAYYTGGYIVSTVGSSFKKSGIKTDMTAGTIEVSHKDGKMLLKADITLKDGTHEEFSAKDIFMLGNTDKSTTLTADKEMDLSKVTEAEANWANLDNGNGSWWFYLNSNLPNTDAITFLIYTQSTDKTVMPIGTFTEGEDGTNVPGVAGKFRPGSFWPDIHQFYTSFYFSNDEKAHYYADQAMVKTGTISITEAANDRYKFTFDLKDENGRKITGEWTGPAVIK